MWPSVFLIKRDGKSFCVFQLALHSSRSLTIKATTVRDPNKLLFFAGTCQERSICYTFNSHTNASFRHTPLISHVFSLLSEEKRIFNIVKFYTRTKAARIPRLKRMFSTTFQLLHVRRERIFRIIEISSIPHKCPPTFQFWNDNRAHKSITSSWCRCTLLIIWKQLGNAWMAQKAFHNHRKLALNAFMRFFFCSNSM